MDFHRGTSAEFIHGQTMVNLKKDFHKESLQCKKKLKEIYFHDGSESMVWDSASPD